MQIKHLVNGEWVEVRQNKLAEAFDHAKAHGSQFDKDLYKIATNVQGHVTQATPVTKTDLTNYGLLDTNAVAPLYSDNTTYSTGEFCIYQGKLYKALQNVDHEEFNPSKWEESNVLTATIGGGTVITGEADWNAQQGDLGYIKNKPDIPEGLPSVSAEDNGKTLVVDDGEWTIGSGGGGGGGGALIVNVDSSTGAIDKTAKELYDAMDTQIVLFKASVSPAEGVVADFYAIVEQRTLINNSLYAFSYAGITGNFPYGGIENAPCSANDYPILSE